MRRRLGRTIGDAPRGRRQNPYPRLPRQLHELAEVAVWVGEGGDDAEAGIFGGVAGEGDAGGLEALMFGMRVVDEEVEDDACGLLRGAGDAAVLLDDERDEVGRAGGEG